MDKLQSTVTALYALMRRDKLIFSGLKLSYAAADVAVKAEFCSDDDHSGSVAPFASERGKKQIIDICKDNLGYEIKPGDISATELLKKRPGDTTGFALASFSNRLTRDDIFFLKGKLKNQNKPLPTGQRV